MDSYLADLLRRMQDRSDWPLKPGQNSSTTIAWQATREAETLTDANLAADLQTHIHAASSGDQKRNAYFALGHLARNLADPMITQYLIDRVDVEPNKYTASGLLDRIADLPKPPQTNLAPLFNAIKRKEWLVRYSAIQSLKHTSDALAETILIAVIETSPDPLEICSANATLNNMGTLRSLPHLEKCLTSRKRDVKLSAVLAIEEILKRSASA